ncbi:hypothetical protein PHMEG_00028719 [Phytophthora megakarya]|uniref:Reverse transcriptase domain-containing protein n=1 Tax=Phytophthora megakarya TaxID=4795 RepID=A0A225V2J7_9STRA|nr:hypothetical protein PHMEG_00028719 [Phytophthora megakarya]
MTPNIANPRSCVDQWSMDGGSPELAGATSVQDDLPDAESSSDRAAIGAIDDDSGVCPRRLPVDDVNSGLTDWGDSTNAQETPANTQYQSEKTSEEALVDLERTFVCVMHVLSTEGRNEPSDDAYDEHEANYISLEDYAQELAFLPDLTEPSVTVLDYEGSNVKNPVLTDEQQQRLVEMLKSHESIMISSGNALPPPAYGVVCDIDVNNHDPIKQRARRMKLYELLKGLLKAGLIAFSNSPSASPIVIVLQKNGEDIRLCIDYKMVNTSYLWFCSPDVASGFWAILMTMRARKVSAFVCALGHFEWLRMPFGLKNAPMIYQRMLDNALWGFVQPKGGWNHFAERMQVAETDVINKRSNISPSWELRNSRTKFHEAGSSITTSE